MIPNDPTYVLHCNNCSYKRHSNGYDLKDLIEIKTVDLQRHLPIYDPNIKKTIHQKDKKRKKMFRCPKCGFTLTAFSVQRIENEQTDRTDGS